MAWSSSVVWSSTVVAMKFNSNKELNSGMSSTVV